jgi:hypothetical protein
MIWSLKPLGTYTHKEGYKALASQGDMGVQKWWWKKISRFKCPSKSCVFSWLLLNNKVLTWDNFQKRNKHGPGWCILC